LRAFWLPLGAPRLRAEDSVSPLVIREGYGIERGAGNGVVAEAEVVPLMSFDKLRMSGTEVPHVIDKGVHATVKADVIGEGDQLPPVCNQEYLWFR